MARVTQALTDFQIGHPLREPQKSPRLFESCPITGVGVLGPAPALGVVPGTPDSGEREEGEGENRYLWVIDARGICYILEAPIQELNHNLPKHSNLASSGEAYIGGEMWFQDPCKIWVSGKSGRYPARNRQEWEDAVGVFASFGYEVTARGWNEETGFPNGGWWES